MANPDLTAPLRLEVGYRPGVIGRIGELHGRYYAEAWGSGAAFEIQMLRSLCDTVEADDPERVRLVTVHAGDEVAGSLLVVRFPEARRAQLRAVIVDPKWQGHGAGRAMLADALVWCRAHGDETVFLWTVEGLPTSRAMYDRAGFRLVERVEDARYSVPLASIKLELDLRVPAVTAAGYAGPR